MAKRSVRRNSRSQGGLMPRHPAPIASARMANSTPSITSEFPLQTSGANDVGKLSISSLTLDTPLAPLKRQSRVPSKSFPFLELPSELRVKVYEYYFSDTDPVLDLGPENYKRIHKTLGFMRVCKQIHIEATHFFYSSRSIRIFPTYPGRYFKTKKPMLARLKKHQRQCITSLELRLGPGWGAPPRSWVVNEALGLADCISVRKVTIFVECDPSDDFYKGFRRSDGFYEKFSAGLMKRVLAALPHANVVEFDGFSGVKKTGAMMRGLLDIAAETKRLIAWGPERGWTDGPEKQTKSNHDATLFIEGISMEGYAPQSVLIYA
ncbi:hypothetical protein UVI_02017300 [Ustilaginoidea virens]|uniref:Uncharacterized protein n=1 Tax=Ustilaginoidea virens TaxID=1159556 RepID=A0A1B5KS13_USTVR|nr:hypothetical protein UVI_02017300 [Ustilaginoidea virens]